MLQWRVATSRGQHPRPTEDWSRIIKVGYIGRRRIPRYCERKRFKLKVVIELWALPKWKAARATWLPLLSGPSGIGITALGQKAKYSLGVNVVRCCPNNRHAATAAPCPFGAKTGSQRLMVTFDRLSGSLRRFCLGFVIEQAADSGDDGRTTRTWSFVALVYPYLLLRLGKSYREAVIPIPVRNTE